jgi:quercetin dioxygenase-like cupin family protein
MLALVARHRPSALLSLLPFALACSAAAAQPAAPPPAPQHPEPITRTLLEHHDLPELPGWEARLYLIEYGPGVSAPLHHHPVPSMGYVFSGSFESAFGDQPPVVVREGQSFMDQAVTPHTLFRNPDPARPLRFVISYVVQKDAPVVLTP